VETLTMNIKREFFAAIVAETKRIEYRHTSPFWKRRIESLTAPFRLRLLNSMTPPIPDAVVIVSRVTRDWAGQEYRLHLGRVLLVKRWNRRAGKPKRCLWGRGARACRDPASPKVRAGAPGR
jgi:hypothetical protein